MPETCENASRQCITTVPGVEALQLLSQIKISLQMFSVLSHDQFDWIFSLLLIQVAVMQFCGEMSCSSR